MAPLTMIRLTITLLFLVASLRAKYSCTRQQIIDRKEDLEVTLNRVQFSFTGTVTHLNSEKTRASVNVKRMVKGEFKNKARRVTVEALRPPCGRQIKVKDTWIFMVNQDNKDTYSQNASLLRITLNNIKHADSIVKNITFIPIPRPARDPCLSVFCTFGSKCEIGKHNKAECVCTHTCDEMYTPVCGSDNITYTNECQLLLKSCKQKQPIEVKSKTECGTHDPCVDKVCDFGAKCVPNADGEGATCKCTTKCYDLGNHRDSKHICGSDGKDYTNICEMKRQSCQSMKSITVEYSGYCDPCRDIECPVPGVCHVDNNRRPFCNCTELCSFISKPLCSMENETFLNECILRMTQCKRRKTIEIRKYAECTDVESPCEAKDCGPGMLCSVDRNMLAVCSCPRFCKQTKAIVCGTDGKQYKNICEMTKQHCGKVTLRKKKKVPTATLR